MSTAMLFVSELCWQGIVVFVIDDSVWTLDLRVGKGKLYEGESKEGSDLKVKATEENFVKLVMGELSPQQVTTHLYDILSLSKIH